jgi:hypothetical protein
MFMIPLEPLRERARRWSCRVQSATRRVAGLAALAAGVSPLAQGAEDEALALFRRDIEPVLDQYCYDCHGYGSDKGGVKLDGFETGQDLLNHELWLRAFKNVRAGLMPPPDEARLPLEEKQQLLSWIKGDVFASDPANPDPGRVTLRRLNRTEYRNTIRDLLGVDFNTETEFPADDTGHGFDNMADVLSISPMLLEKYLDAAQTIIERAVPAVPRVPAEQRVPGRELRSTIPVVDVVQAALAQASATGAARGGGAVATASLPPQAGTVVGSALDLSYYAPASVAANYHAVADGEYQVVVNLKTVERYVDDLFDYNTCEVRVKVDGETVLQQEFVREGERDYVLTFNRNWKAGPHEVVIELEPKVWDQPQHRHLRIRLNAVTARGPMTPEHWVPPPRYAEFFPGTVPEEPEARRAYTRERLEHFATRAYRRPVDAATVERLADLAEDLSSEPGQTYEAGVAQAMVAVLASPRFLFRDEEVLPAAPDEAFPLLDEWALASRLSYFLWSSMPDAELFELARRGELRAQLLPQLERMLADPKSDQLVRNFTGQWLQARDITTVSIENFDVFLRDHPNPEVEEARKTFRKIVPIAEPDRTPEQREAFATARATFINFVRGSERPQLTPDLREAMQRETELLFDHVLRQDRSVVDFLNADYVHVNERLAKHYGIEGVEGDELRLVKLPPGSPRGGVLTQGTVLAVTSNPNRTSPVKRGVFILDNILGAPPPPPPPDIPSLEEAAGGAERLKELSLRETLALHAENRLCRSCHNRMDPLGLALENFNAMGVWREQELNQPVEPHGKLMSGHRFAGIQELKEILATHHRQDFYYCLTEKLLKYALGRGVEYYDTETLDRLVEQLDAADGRLTTLIAGIVQSAPFQRRRPAVGDLELSTPPGTQHAHAATVHP